MSKYCNISDGEMRDFLKIEKGWKETVQTGYTKEIVFEYRLTKYPQIVVKVYSGIKQNSGQSRDCGKDAIRVCAVNTATNAGWISVSRVYRVMGWRENLKARILEVIGAAEDRCKQYTRPIYNRPNTNNLRAEAEIYQIESQQI